MSFYFFFVNTKVKTLKNKGKSCPLNFWSLGSEVLDIALIVGLLFCKGDTYHFSLTALLFPMLCGIGCTVPTTELTEGKVHFTIYAFNWCALESIVLTIWLSLLP